MKILGLPIEGPDHKVEQTPKLEVFLWDEISGEWGEAYPDVDPNDNLAVHRETAKFIDLELDIDDKIKYRVNVEGLGINIGYWGRHALYIEVWGEGAANIISLIKAEAEWFPSSEREALNSLVDFHATWKRARGD